MPNWYYNVLTITGNKEELEHFKKRAIGSHPYGLGEPPSAFNPDSLMPIPQEVIEGEEDYFEWVYANWGCRRIGDCRLESETENELVYMFESANGAPESLLVYLGRQWPGLTFQDSFHEPMNLPFAWVVEVKGETVTSGPGCIEDAIAEWREQAKYGMAGGQYNLGVCYANGQGVERDIGEAVRLWRLAAAKGNEGAIKALAIEGK